MTYQLNELKENKINPLTGCEYDNSWLIFRLTDSKNYRLMCGSNNGCAYTIEVSRTQYKDWKLAIGDFISFNEMRGKNIQPIGVMPGDPINFSDYIMFSGGTTGEI